jgi:hypothetical protein
VIRKATAHDLQAIIDMGYRLCDRTPQSQVKRDRQAIAQTITTCMNSSLGCCFVSERGGRLSGVILGVAQQYWFSRQRQAVDLMFTSEHPGDGLRLLRKFVDWAWAVPGVVEVTMAQSSGIEVERTGRVFERVGFHQVGGVYSMMERPKRAQSRAA